VNVNPSDDRAMIVRCPADIAISELPSGSLITDGSVMISSAAKVSAVAFNVNRIPSSESAMHMARVVPAADPRPPRYERRIRPSGSSAASGSTMLAGAATPSSVIALNTRAESPSMRATQMAPS